jgi:hypothetical protein
MILVAIIAFLVGATLSAVTTALVMREPAAPSETVESAEAATGDDPAVTPCIDDAAVATSAEGAATSLIEIIWSNECQAGWGRITRYDGLIEGNTVTIAIYPETAQHGPDRQGATEHDVQGAYTDLMVRPTPETLLCAEGSFTVEGEGFDVGPRCACERSWHARVQGGSRALHVRVRRGTSAGDRFSRPGKYCVRSCHSWPTRAWGS